MSGGRPASIRYTYHNKHTRVEIDVLGAPKKAKRQSTLCETSHDKSRHGKRSRDIPGGQVNIK